jgi:hypothetical protein
LALVFQRFKPLNLCGHVDRRASPLPIWDRLDPAFSYLRRVGYAEFEDEGVLIEGWPVQFLPVASDLDVEGLDQAIEAEIESIKVRVLRPELIEKVRILKAMRERDAMIRRAREARLGKAEEDR